MQFIPNATETHATYENFIAKCPFCSHYCTFNRASDLCTFRPIIGLEVRCLTNECQACFRLTNDSVNERHEMLIFDSRELLSRKQYMYCILNLAIAYESFFSLYLRVELLYKPYVADPQSSSKKLEQLNALSQELQEKTKRHTFQTMRALFLRRMIDQQSVASLCDATRIIDANIDHPLDVSNSDIEALKYSDAALIQLLKDLNRTKIHELRNRVVHRGAYRPTREEAEECLDETESILFPLTGRLQLHDDLNFYVSERT